MRRLLVAATLVAGCFAVVSARAGSPAAEDSARAALQEELESLLEEIDRADPVDLFSEGREPDLVILSSNSMLGEITPCG